MIYILLFFVLTVLFLFAKHNKRNLKKVIFFSAVIVTLLVAMRHPTMGRDLGSLESGGYISSFFLIGNMDWSSFFSNFSFLNYEIGYIFFSKVVYFIFPNSQFLLVICAVLSIIPFFILFAKYSKSCYFSIVVYLSLPLFLLSYSGLRQAIAIGFCCIACCFIEKKCILKYIICVIIASLFHSSALFFLPAYPIFYLKISRKTRFILLSILPIAFLLKNQIFARLIKVFGVSVSLNENESFLFFVFLSFIYFLFVLFFGENQNGWMNMLFIACIIQAFSGLNTLILRICYYYIISLPIVIPNVINEMKNKKIKLAFSICFFLVFIIFGIYSIKNTYWAEAYPYHFFWETL